MTVIPLRGHDGRFASHAPAGPRYSLDQAREIYQAYLAAVCQHQDLRPREVERQLARPGKPNVDIQWRRAAYARQLALYLANTAHNVPQKLLAEVAGITPAAVCLALKAIEDLRDIRSFDTRVDIVAAEMRIS
ncbi:hypothetical protein AC629_42285 [Bradyrhizobium sp. NAS80.1]|uniref:hypothetical protein n=1 Tax=Bradyrhizobium sp. NAS80.1 TaxID=1680159 RepID=UPI00095A8FC4|nr:hypothetical protein [Bradyrhizobium sp. NAS80.1]OKO68202.1 hypothetical protein AC629_42285 [Bradyrhizobium sp. NAS80.1]